MTTSQRVRIRLICITCLTFGLMQIVNSIGIFWAFGELRPQHGVMLLMMFGIMALLPLLRHTQNASLLGWVFSIASFSGLWLATYVDHAGNPNDLEIGAAYTPYMVVGLVFVSLIGTKRTAVAFTLLSLATLIGFFSIGVALHYSPEVIAQSKVGLSLRCTSILLTAAIMIPASRVIYEALETIEAALHRARSAEIARADFLARMSHEIRTPLHGILGLSDMLHRSKLPDAQKKSARLIHVSANNLMEIVNEVLDMAKLEEGILEIAENPFNPRTMIQDICDLFEAKASEKNLWIGASVAENVPETLIGDEPHLRQVLSNLAGNAIKFTHDGGVRIGARIATDQAEAIAIQFYVQDTGVGIAKDEQQGVFDRFTQTASSQTSKTKGTGLGLSICRELTERMGATLELASEPGKGTVFYFTVTLARPNAQPSQAA